MTSLTGAPENVNAQTANGFRARSPLSLMIGGVSGVVCLFVLFYGVENWRGRRAWEQCKRNLAAQGAWPDESAHVPAAVPDEQNVFKASGMAEWFLGPPPNNFTSRLIGAGLS